jgi:hypothetical protein
MNDPFFELPILQVAEVEPSDGGGAIVRGRLSGARLDADLNWPFLWTGAADTPTVAIRSLDANSGAVEIIIEAEDLRDTIQPGAALHWSTYHQAWHADIILAGRWTRQDFTPEVQDSFWHEHSEICSARIGDPDATFGYVDDNDAWLCPECYETWAVSRSLGFMV